MNLQSVSACPREPAFARDIVESISDPMVVYDAGAGEIRTHYAGFFDPGFGFGDGSVLGTRVVMEVRAREVPFMLYDGQTSFKVWFERLVILWVGVASIPFLVLDSYSQTRILYDLPIPVLMSSALLFFLPAVSVRNIRSPGIIIILILVLCANYALQGILLL